VSAILWPITEEGSGDKGSDLLLYAQRDFYGVEAVAASPTDFRGFNEMTAWTRRTYDAAAVEHYASGLHNSVKVCRTVCTIEWDGVAYSFVAESYGQVGSSGARSRGSAVGTAVRAGAGLVTVTLVDPLPGASNYKLMDFTPGEWDLATNKVKLVRVLLNTVTDATHFQVVRLAGTTFSTTAPADGNMQFVVHW
jgi:hypothetical protein